jgi:accessory gene regulator B
MHASKSWICLLSSTLVFILASLICKNIEFSMGFRVIFGLIGIILMYKNSPADTKKKPIVSPKRRKTYKIISIVLAISFVILSLIINNVFLDNSFILALIIQNVLISPATYKLFNEPYDNYKSYQM